MPWSPPAVPITGTTITVSFANALITTGLNWLRQLTGNGDPPGADYVAVSTSPSTTSWQKVTTNLITNGHVTDVKLADPKVSRTIVNYGTLADAAAAGTGYAVSFQSGGNVDGPFASDWFSHTFDYPGGNRRLQNINSIYNTADVYTRVIIAGTPTAWVKVWNSGNDGSGSTLDADLLDGQSSAFYATAASVAALATVPTGLIAAFRTAAAIASGWTRFTDGDGRLLVGAGTTFSQTFTENTAVGSNWTPFAGAGGFTGTAADTITVQSGTGASASATSHQNSLSIPAQTWNPVSRVVVHAIKS